MELVSALGVASAVIALSAVVLAWRTFRQGAELQAFLNLTARYEDIMSELPRRARLEDTWGPNVDPEFEVRLRYLNLCSEEYYLMKKGLLSSRVWDIWEAEIRRALASQPYRDAWEALHSQFGSYPAFSEFVAQCQETTSTADPDSAPRAGKL